MIARMLISATAAISLIAVPAIAQNTDMSGHHYQGGPKTEALAKFVNAG